MTELIQKIMKDLEVDQNTAESVLNDLNQLSTILLKAYENK